MIEQIRKLYWAKPFIPFTIHLADGRALAVSHPESMALGPNGRSIAVYQADGAFHTVIVSLITDVAESPKSARAKG